MSEVFFISDLHFGHKRIIDFEPEFRTGDTPEENMEYIVREWNKKINKRDVVYVLGDVAFSWKGLEAMHALKGQLRLIKGNHDQFKIEEYQKIFTTIDGMTKYKNYWLTHCPIHPAEMYRAHGNIHGHVHSNTVRDPITEEFDKRYINVSCEAVNEVPISFDEIHSGKYWDITRIKTSTKIATHD